MLPTRPRSILPCYALAAAAVLLPGEGAAEASVPEFSPEMVQTSQPRLVDGSQVVSRSLYQQTLFAPCGNGITSCYKTFYTVPPKSRLDIDHLSCSFTVRAPGYIDSAIVGFLGKNKATFDYHVPVKLGDDGSFQQFALNADARVAGTAGKVLAVAMNATNDVSNMNCTVTGELLKLK